MSDAEPTPPTQSAQGPCPAAEPAPAEGARATPHQKRRTWSAHYLRKLAEKPPKSVVCEEFLKGTCTQGSKCPFIHVVLPGSAAAAALADEAAAKAAAAAATPTPAAKEDASAGETKKKKKKSKKKKCKAKKAASDHTEAAPAAVCPDYVLGQCRRGHACPLRHPAGVLNPAGMVCPFYTRGDTCPHGAACVFAHVRAGDPAYHTRPCLLHRRGLCPNGDACVFFHEAAGVARPADARSTTLCAYWQRGFCRRGAQCPFAHPDALWALQMPPQPQPQAQAQGSDGVTHHDVCCRYWARGLCCPAGDKCLYRHDLFLGSGK